MQFRTLIKPDFFDRMFAAALSAALITGFLYLVLGSSMDVVIVYLWTLIVFLPLGLLYQDGDSVPVKEDPYENDIFRINDWSVSPNDPNPSKYSGYIESDGSN
jgi:hypothetical protein